MSQVRILSPRPFLSASSSAGQSNGLLSRGSRVRVLPGAPFWLSGTSFLALVVKLYLVVGVAQSVEHWIVAPVVAGSIPVTHPIIVPGLPFPRQPLNIVAVLLGKAGP